MRRILLRNHGSQHAKGCSSKVRVLPRAHSAVDAGLRSLIFEVATEDGIDDLAECLKWGEPSYLCKHGSTLRMDWKEKAPNQYALYFHCQTKLIATFRELYPQELEFSDNRAILFQVDKALPRNALKHCISLTLRYHLVKNEPLLGA